MAPVEGLEPPIMRVEAAGLIQLDDTGINYLLFPTPCQALHPVDFIVGCELRMLHAIALLVSPTNLFLLEILILNVVHVQKGLCLFVLKVNFFFDGHGQSPSKVKVGARPARVMSFSTTLFATFALIPQAPVSLGS